MFTVSRKPSQNQVRPGLAERLLSKRVISIVSFFVMLFVFLAPLALAQGNVLTDPPKTFELTQGWYEGRQTFYYDFGANTAATGDGQSTVTAPIYVLVTGFNDDGSPIAVEGQRNIIDVIPGDEGYSDLWQVTFVTVPEDYVANTIVSADEVLSGGYEMTTPGVYVNCPVVPPGSTLSEGGAPLVQGWYKGQDVSYFDFGPNTVATAPIYAFVTGFDDAGNPQFVEGQNNVVGVVPGDEGYSAFWYVNLVVVPDGYVANTITAAGEVMASGYEMVQPGLLVNCPVLRTDAMSPEQLPVSGGTMVNWIALPLLAGLGVLCAGLLLRRKLIAWHT